MEDALIMIIFRLIEEYIKKKNLGCLQAFFSMTRHSFCLKTL